MILTLTLTLEDADRVIARYTENPPVNDTERMLLRAATQAAKAFRASAPPPVTARQLRRELLTMANLPGLPYAERLAWWEQGKRDLICECKGCGDCGAPKCDIPDRSCRNRKWHRASACMDWGRSDNDGGAAINAARSKVLTGIARVEALATIGDGNAPELCNAMTPDRTLLCLLPKRHDGAHKWLDKGPV